jgi:hypothetical protein
MGKRRIHAMGLKVALVSFTHPVKLQLTQRHSPSLDSSLTFVVTLLHDGSFGDKCLGKIDIGMGRLLELQSQQLNEGEYHLPVDRNATIDNSTI